MVVLPYQCTTTATAYAVLDKTLLTDNRKAIVRRYESTNDAQKVYSDLISLIIWDQQRQPLLPPTFHNGLLLLALTLDNGVAPQKLSPPTGKIKFVFAIARKILLIVSQVDIPSGCCGTHQWISAKFESLLILRKPKPKRLFLMINDQYATRLASAVVAYDTQHASTKRHLVRICCSHFFFGLCVHLCIRIERTVQVHALCSICIRLVRVSITARLFFESSCEKQHILQGSSLSAIFAWNEHWERENWRGFEYWPSYI